MILTAISFHYTLVRFMSSQWKVKREACLSLRTSMSVDAADPGSETAPILYSHVADRHVRGSWPYSALQLVASEPIDLYTMTSPVRFEICANPGEELKRFMPRDGDTGALKNNGLYGVNIRYEVPIKNTSSPTQNYLLEVFLRGRNLPQKYFGAIVDQQYAGIPALASGEAIVLMPATTVGRVIPNFVLENATGGACATPVDLVFAWTPV